MAESEMGKRWKLLRYAVGRWLMHAGLRAMPRGRTRALIADKLFDARCEIDAALSPSPAGEGR